MTCTHIRQVVKKMNELVEKIGNENGNLYKNLGTYVKEEEAEVCLFLDGVESACGLNERCRNHYTGGSTSLNFKRKYNIKAINEKVLGKYLSEIGELINNCDCYNELARNSVSKSSAEKLETEYKKNVKDYNELIGEYKVLGEKVKNLQEKYNKLVDEYNDKVTDYQDMKEKYDDTNEKLHGEKLKYTKNIGDEKLKHSGEKSQLQIQNTRLQEKLEASNSEKIDLRKRLKDKEEENGRLLIKLDDRNNQLTVLRIESGKKDSDLERKNEEIKNLKTQAKSSDKRAEKTQEELLTEKIRSEKGNLELFATELRVGLEQTNGLIRYHERLLRARKDYNQANIETHENNVTRIKEELQNAEISIVNIQEICRKCERIAELRWELEQNQQQFEARQEVPTNH